MKNSKQARINKAVYAVTVDGVPVSTLFHTRKDARAARKIIAESHERSDEMVPVRISVARLFST